MNVLFSLFTEHALQLDTLTCTCALTSGHHAVSLTLCNLRTTPGCLSCSKSNNLPLSEPGVSTQSKRIKQPLHTDNSLRTLKYSFNSFKTLSG